MEPTPAMSSPVTSSSSVQQVSPYSWNITNPVISSYILMFDGHYFDYTQINVVRLLFIISYSVIIFLSFFGNIMVIWTVWRNKHMHTVTNCYIVNLAISDVLMSSLIMPQSLIQYAVESESFLSVQLCMAIYYLEGVFVSVGVLTLEAVSLERYFAIVHPLNSIKLHSAKRAKKILVVIWVIPLLAFIPVLNQGKIGVFNMVSDWGSIYRMICHVDFQNISLYFHLNNFEFGYTFFLFMMLYLIPLLFTGITCVMIVRHLLFKDRTDSGDLLRGQAATLRAEENRKKVAKMVIAVVIAFFIAWTPFYIYHLRDATSPNNRMHVKSHYFFVLLLIKFLAYSNSSVNPMIYMIMSKRFRWGFIDLFKLVFCCVRKRSSANSSTQSDQSRHSYEMRDTIADRKKRARFLKSPVETPSQDSSSGFVDSDPNLRPVKLRYADVVSHYENGQRKVGNVICHPNGNVEYVPSASRNTNPLGPSKQKLDGQSCCFGNSHKSNGSYHYTKNNPDFDNGRNAKRQRGHAKPEQKAVGQKEIAEIAQKLSETSSENNTAVKYSARHHLHQPCEMKTYATSQSEGSPLTYDPQNTELLSFGKSCASTPAIPDCQRFHNIPAIRIVDNFNKEPDLEGYYDFLWSAPENSSYRSYINRSIPSLQNNVVPSAHNVRSHVVSRPDGTITDQLQTCLRQCTDNCVCSGFSRNKFKSTNVDMIKSTETSPTAGRRGHSFSF